MYWHPACKEELRPMSISVRQAWLRLVGLQKRQVVTLVKHPERQAADIHIQLIL
jgi:hypothetical protein